MSNTAFPKGAQRIWTAGVNFSADTIKAMLAPDGYTFSAAHEFVSDLGVAAIGTDQTLGSKTITGGVFDAADVTYGVLAPGSTIKAVVLYKDTGNPSTSPLLLYMDTITGLPMATNGGIISIPWSDGAKKIARLNLPMYPLGGQKVLAAAINMLTDTIKVALLPSSYTYNAAHEFLADVGTRIGTDQTLANKSVTDGVIDADDSDFGTIAAGSTIGSVILYKDTGNAATSPLLMRFSDVVGTPLATNGAGVALQWNNGAAKIVSLKA